MPPAFPIIIGAARSGTTLLRLMLDAHPEMAIGPETGFLAKLALLDGRGDLIERTRTIILNSEAWHDFGINERDLCQDLDLIEPFDISEACRCFYRLYARKFGKHRFGDKTPGYCFYMPQIAALLPEVHFIHLIRDGRDAALSLRRMWFSPGPDMATQAEYWAKFVLAGREGSRHCTRYFEVRYEQLISDPPTVLGQICDFLDLPFRDSMLNYHLQAATRLQEHQGRVFPNGTVLSREDRFAQQVRSTLPPQADCAYRWETEMTITERECFLRVAGPLLEELGYSIEPDHRPHALPNGISG